MSVVNAARAARTVPLNNTTTSAASESIVITAIDVSDASAVVADVLNRIVNTVDSGATAGIRVDPSVQSEDSAEGCGFAIDTAPTVEDVIVKTENDPEVGPLLEGSNAKTSTIRVEVGLYFLTRKTRLS